MTTIIPNRHTFWRRRGQLVISLFSFLSTVVIASKEHWSAVDMAWSFWLAGLLLGSIYLMVYQAAQGDRETLLAYLPVFLFFYFIFAGFLSFLFSWAMPNPTEASASSPVATMPTAIVHAARQRWTFLVLSGISFLPDYVLDARTVNFTDVSKPLFAPDMLRMIILIFLLVGLTLAQLGHLALYALLFVYFFPIRGGTPGLSSGEQE